MTRTKESWDRTPPKFTLLLMPLGKKAMLQILSDWQSCPVNVLCIISLLSTDGCLSVLVLKHFNCKKPF